MIELGIKTMNYYIVDIIMDHYWDTEKKSVDIAQEDIPKKWWIDLRR